MDGLRVLSSIRRLLEVVAGLSLQRHPGAILLAVICDCIFFT